MTTFNPGIMTPRLNPAGSSPQDDRAFRRLLLGRSPKKTILRILILVAASFITFKLVLTPVRITGDSMEPTCHDGRVGFINLLAYVRQEPQRGDIVGIRFGPQDPIMVKRVIALPGERIAIHAGAVFINGARLAEPYLTSPGAWEWPEETLDKNNFYVAGDNRMISRQFTVGRNQIFGKLLGQARN